MANNRNPGPVGTSTRSPIPDAGTLALRQSSPPAPTGTGDEVSFELGDAPFISVPTTLGSLSPAEMRVLVWLRQHRTKIAAVEQKYRVDRRAIAGAIAWEALENVRGGGIRAFGAGKVHVYAHRIGTFVFGEDTVAAQIEERGYLPKQTTADRIALLRTAEGSIDYIAAIMAAFSDIAGRYGYDIRGDPVILTNVFQSKDLKTWEAHLKAKPKGAGLRGGNTMDIWVGTHLPFLEEGVGQPNLPESSASSRP